MPKGKDITHSLLIVSASDQFNEIVRRSLGGSVLTEWKKNGAMARKSVLERYYDLIVINGPLPDENGLDLCYDFSSQCSASILFVVPRERYEDNLEKLSGRGIMVLGKPFPKGRVDKAIRYLLAVQARFREMERKVNSLEERLEELRIVSRAKIHLVEKEHMTEEEAHHYIEKTAMDMGVKKRRIAEKILDDGPMKKEK